MPYIDLHHSFMISHYNGNILVIGMYLNLTSHHIDTHRQTDRQTHTQIDTHTHTHTDTRRQSINISITTGILIEYLPIQRMFMLDSGVRCLRHRKGCFLCVCMYTYHIRWGIQIMSRRILRVLTHPSKIHSKTPFWPLKLPQIFWKLPWKCGDGA